MAGLADFARTASAEVIINSIQAEAGANFFIGAANGGTPFGQPFFFTSDHLQDNLDAEGWAKLIYDVIVGVAPKISIHASSIEGKGGAFLGPNIGFLTGQGFSKLVLSFTLTSFYVADQVLANSDEGATISTVPQAHSVVGPGPHTISVDVAGGAQLADGTPGQGNFADLTLDLTPLDGGGGPIGSGTPVDEPATLALFAAGLVSMGSLRFSRRRATAAAKLPSVALTSGDWVM
jgi:hypothetical protein